MENNNAEKNSKSAALASYRLRRKPDGTPYRSRKDMKENYQNSRLFYPFSAIWNLDYCWNICKSHFKNTFFFTMPLAFVVSYALNPEIRTKGFKSRPFAYYASVYIFIYSCLSSYFIIDALAFCDYCKPWSPLYNLEDRSDKYREMLKSKIKGEQSSIDVKINKTKHQGLKDEEI
jgi:hypothetical protein